MKHLLYYKVCVFDFETVYCLIHAHTNEMSNI